MRRWLCRPRVHGSLMLALGLVLAAGILVPAGPLAAGPVPAVSTPGLGGTPAAVRPAPPAQTPTTGASAGPGPAVAPTPASPASLSTATVVATPPATAVLSATVSAGPTPVTVQLDGQDHQLPLRLAIRVEADAGMAPPTGWQLTLTLAPFRSAGAPARALPADAVTLVGVTVVCAPETTGTPPANRLTAPRALPADTAVPIYATAPGTGQGAFVLTPTLLVRVPGNAYAGTYQTTIAVTIAAGA